MPDAWPAPSYGAWSATCETLHAHTQVLGKLAVELAPPEPQLQHAALRLSARGWETPPLLGTERLRGDRRGPRPALARGAWASTGRARPRRRGSRSRPTGRWRKSRARCSRPSSGWPGRSRSIPRPRRCPGGPLDEDREHATYDPEQVATYFDAATRAALVLAEFRAPFRGRSTPVNAWWGTFDLAVNLVLGPGGRSAVGRLPHAQWRRCPAGRGRLVPGDRRTAGGLLRLRVPAADGFGDADRGPTRRTGRGARRVRARVGGIRERADAHALALEFAARLPGFVCSLRVGPGPAATVEGVLPPSGKPSGRRGSPSAG